MPVLRFRNPARHCRYLRSRSFHLCVFSPMRLFTSASVHHLRLFTTAACDCRHRASGGWYRRISAGRTLAAFLAPQAGARPAPFRAARRRFGGSPARSFHARPRAAWRKSPRTLKKESRRMRAGSANPCAASSLRRLQAVPGGSAWPHLARTKSFETGVSAFVDGTIIPRP